MFIVAALTDRSILRALAIVLTFLVAGIVKGVTGMGLPTIAMGLLGSVMPPVDAASLLIAPSFVTNIWQLFAGPNVVALASRLRLMLLGIVVGTIAGSWILSRDRDGWTVMGLGAALMVYAVISLLNRKLSVPPRTERQLSPFIGLVTGLMTGGTGVFVIPAVPYLQALSLNRDDLIQALGLSFTVSTIALAIGLAKDGVFQGEGIGVSVLAILPALLGMWLGQRIRRRVSLAAFRRWFLICLLALGLQLLLRPFF
ncbi:MAG TPA: sulfite exporter TauE/SafE family protein [Telmatospirillum sp.]|nr:sulfite exporter TauE/SafE family protein [Telmatospirillum sp.]